MLSSFLHSRHYSQLLFISSSSLVQKAFDYNVLSSLQEDTLVEEQNRILFLSLEALYMKCEESSCRNIRIYSLPGPLSRHGMQGVTVVSRATVSLSSTACTSFPSCNGKCLQV